MFRFYWHDTHLQCQKKSTIFMDYSIKVVLQLSYYNITTRSSCLSMLYCAELLSKLGM